MISAPHVSAISLLLLVLLLTGCVGQPQRQDLQSKATRPYSSPMADRDPDQDSETAPIPETRPATPQMQTKGLWARLGSGFSLEVPTNAQVSREIAWLRRHPEHVTEIAHRARPFLWFIAEAAEARHLPLELALLPAVESGFRPRARSRFGAMGLWQIMPSTARALGLDSNAWYNGCFDPLASTDAAFTYLEQLGHRFGGDWLLALAAYNAGPGAVTRALEYNRKHHRPTDYWHLRLPPQTRTYVPRLLALATVIARPQAYGVHLRPLPDRPLLARVEIPAPLDLGVAARLAAMDVQSLRTFNPGYIAEHTPPGGTYGLLLPITIQGKFEARLAGLNRAAWRPVHQHRVAPGENLWHIARRYGTSVAALRRVNGLSSDQLRVGQRLRLPSPGRIPSPVTHYVVRPGDNLWSIARRFGLDHRRIAVWNDLSLSRPLYPGQRLVLAPRSL